MDLIRVLRDQGVTEFSNGDTRLVLGPEPVVQPVVTPEAAKSMRPIVEEPRGRAAYNHPSLWGGQTPPEFQ